MRHQHRYLLQIPPTGSNLLLVSHVQGSRTPADVILIEPAELVVYRGVGLGKAEPLARIPLGAWKELFTAQEALR